MAYLLTNEAGQADQGVARYVEGVLICGSERCSTQRLTNDEGEVFRESDRQCGTADYSLSSSIVAPTERIRCRIRSIVSASSSRRAIAKKRRCGLISRGVSPPVYFRHCRPPCTPNSSAICALLNLSACFNCSRSLGVGGVYRMGEGAASGLPGWAHHFSDPLGCSESRESATANEHNRTDGPICQMKEMNARHQLTPFGSAA